MSGLQVEDGTQGWWRLDTVFWLTIGLVFLLTIVNVMLRRRKRDAALRMLDDSPVTVILADDTAVAGRLLVTSQGVEVVLDQPESSRAGVLKSSMLIYEPELAMITAIARAPQSLSDAERERRRAELERRISPGPMQSLARFVRNVFNSTRDAILQSFGLLVGRLRPGGTVTTALRGQEQGLMGVGQSVIGLAGNAYEPLLESRFGDPVIVQIAASTKSDPPPPARELAGHLVAYSDKFLCIMANGWDMPRRASLVSPGSSTPTIAGEALRMERQAGVVKLLALGPQAVLLCRIRRAGRDMPNSRAVLLEGSRLELAAGDLESIEVDYELTRAVDLVVPRSRSQVRFGAMPPSG